jgi:molybdopterin-guanine dinucleotide biosynthesis protein A
MSAAAPLHGLLLAGGSSTRMQRDKATLDYHGRPQLHWAYDLLRAHCERVFVSVRPDQVADPARAALPQIVDEHDGIGPIAGIAAAQAFFPDAAWLVLACDLPFVSERTLAHLIAMRDPSQPATAFRSSSNGMPEPLCAIYEPGSRSAILESIAQGRNCPRKFLARSRVPLLELLDSSALDNVNTPQELSRATAQLETGGGRGAR